MRLAIADPPYPPMIGSGGRKNRASRWYGSGQLSTKDKPSDFHERAADWDRAETHRHLLLDLADRFDGWAIATSADGVAAYGPLPVGCRTMVWVKPNAQPGSHRILCTHEIVIVYPPVGRRSNRRGAGSMRDVLVANAPGRFIGRKPPEWTVWVLSALGHEPSDDVTDVFPGSGAVSEAIAAQRG